MISERELYLEEILGKAIKNNGNLRDTLADISDPFSGYQDGSEYLINGKSCWDWYEENIFNETVLYHKLWKDEARSVLGIYNRFKKMCMVLHEMKKAEKK